MNPEAEADQIRRAYWNDEGFPVDPVAIAKELGVLVFNADIPGDVSGLLRKHPGQAAEIYLDTDDPLVRRRFTCAHELGHYVSHVGDDSDSMSFVDYRGPLAAKGSDPDEVFANRFAANLLMPRQKVRELRGLGVSAVQMAKFFHVSLEAMNNRLASIGGA
jgi:Zn-dependent peptidase ImmA (M78 family)